MLMVITPVVGLPANVPLKPGAEAVKVTTVPLSVGGAEGVTVVPAPVLIGPVAGYVPSVGAVFAVTVTGKVVLLLSPVLSVTVSVKAALVAPHAAPTSAVTEPAPLMAKLLTVTPLTVADEVPLTITARVLAAWLASLTEAIWELIAALPCCRTKGVGAGTIDGAVLVRRQGENSEVLPLLSVAVAVIKGLPPTGVKLKVKPPGAASVVAPAKTSPSPLPEPSHEVLAKNSNRMG